MNANRLIQHLENSLSTRQTGLDTVDDICDMSHLIRKFMQKICEDEKPGSQSQFASNHQHAAITNQHEHIGLSQQAHRRLKGRDAKKDRGLQITNIVIGFAKLVGLFRFTGESFDNLDSLQILHERANHHIAKFACSAISRLNHSGEDHSPGPQQRCCCQARQSQFHMHSKHVGQKHGQCQKHCNESNDNTVDKVADVVGITGGSIDN